MEDLIFIRQDFARFLEEIGVTEDVLEQTRVGCIVVASDLHFCLRPSPIAGLGIFPCRNRTHVAAVGRVDEDWTLAGRFTNHSPRPSARPELDNYGRMIFMPNHLILETEELTVDYRAVRRLLQPHCHSGQDQLPSPASHGCPR